MSRPARKRKAVVQAVRGDRRTYGRRRQELLDSNFGPVLDLSLGGARISTRAELEGEVDLVIKADSGELTLPATVRWVRRVGFRKYEAGLMFLQLDDLAAQRLAEISTQHRLWYDECA
jgi:hypothetical protein